jgi:methionyl-tRNA formyltransferase
MKILVVCDNIYVIDRIKSVFDKKSNADFEVDFKYSSKESPVSEHPLLSSDYSHIDVKDACDAIIARYNLVISAHCLQFFPKKLVESVRCVNIHPGYNPINRGWYPQVFSIIHNLPVGATIHEMDAKLDNGAIIVRSLVEKYSWDTSLTLYNRILEKELELFEAHFDEIIYGGYTAIVPESEGNLFNRKDFDKLCEIDLNEQGTIGMFINKLRALSHGSYRNAYFIDEDGNKVFLKIELDRQINE